MNIKDIWWNIKETGKNIAWKCRDGIKWAIDNPDKAAAIAAASAAVTGGVSKVVRSVNKNVTIRREMKERRTRIYDHSMNAYLYTKRPLRASDIERINAERRRTGKRTSEILSEMNLLKR